VRWFYAGRIYNFPFQSYIFAIDFKSSENISLFLPAFIMNIGYGFKLMQPIAKPSLFYTGLIPGGCRQLPQQRSKQDPWRR
jgi:hypothetical protein